MIRIVSDSTCDLSPELRERYGVAIVPLNIILGDKEYQDGESITPDEIYQWADAQRTTPKTAACSVEQVCACLGPMLEAGDEVICFSISGHMSMSGNAMRLAAQELEAEDRVSVIDSASLSTGVGLLVIEAAEMARMGMERAEIVRRVEAMKPRVSASFVVDTLTYLYRGGRCSGLSAMLGGALKIHPRIVVKDGKLQPDKKYRGSMRLVLRNYAQDLEAELRAAKHERVFVTHSGCDEEQIQAVKDYLTGLGCFDEVLVTRAGGVISSHCGRGTLGILFIQGE